MFLVYKHTNKLNGRAYIGYTSKSIEVRWQEHCNAAIISNSSTTFHKAIKKFGVENWEHEILVNDIQSIDDAKQLEIQLITEHWTYVKHPFSYGYNMTQGGDGKSCGSISSDETCKKISVAHKGKKLTKQHSQKISNALKGRQFSALHHKHLSKSRIGQKNSFYGKTHTAEFKKKISEQMSKPVEQYDKCGNFIARFESITQAINIVGNGHISEVCDNTRKSACGFMWKWSTKNN